MDKISTIEVNGATYAVEDTEAIHNKGSMPIGESVKTYKVIGTFTFYSANVTDLPADFGTGVYGWLVNIAPTLKLLWCSGDSKFYVGNGVEWYRVNYQEPENALGGSATNVVSQYTVSNWLRAIVNALNSANGMEFFTNSVGTKSSGYVISAVSGEMNKYTDQAGYSVITHEIALTEPFFRVKASANWSNYLYSFIGLDNKLISGERTTSANNTVQTIDKIVEVPYGARWILVSEIAPNESGIFNGGISVTPAKKWTGKKWTCVGDSLTERNGRTTKNYHDYIAEETGVTVVNMGVSGTGYKRQDGNSIAFYQRISNVPTDSDVVTIFGSGNDMGAGVELGTPTDTGTDTLCGCINTTIDNLIAIMPTVQLGIVTPTPWVGYSPATDNAMKNYANAIVEICKNRSIPCLDLYHCSNLRPWTEEGRNACYTKDDGNGVHPDETGHKIIASRFKGFLETLLL